MRAIKTYFKGAPFYNAFLRTWPSMRNKREDLGVTGGTDNDAPWVQRSFRPVR